jgi:hypothetical protein
VKTFEERKAGNHIVSCSESDCDRPSTPTLSIVRCNFWDIKNEGTSAKFSLTELDDKSGFVVDMRDVTVIPSHYIFIKSAPAWLKFLIRKFGGAV